MGKAKWECDRGICDHPVCGHGRKHCAYCPSQSERRRPRRSKCPGCNRAKAKRAALCKACAEAGVTAEQLPLDEAI